MKKILFSIILSVAALAGYAQDYTTVTLKAGGTLATVLQDNNATKAEYLKIICAEGVYMNQTDFEAIRANLRNTLKGLDLLEAPITFFETRGAFPDSGLQAMYNLETVFLPENMISIGQYGFNLCYSLKTINLPNSIKFFRPYCFQGCESLQIDKLPDSLQEINERAFYSQANTQLSNAGFSYTPKSSILGLTASELPAGVTKIDVDAFNGTSVSFSELPEGLVALGDRAFRNTNVTFREFPASLFEEGSEIGSAVFVNCLGITEFVIPDEMTSIPNQTFYWDKTVTAPRIFYCNQTTPPKAAYDTSAYTGSFGNSNSFSNVTMFVPLEAVSAYESKSPVTPYSTMNIAATLYLVGSMTAGGENQDGYANPSFKFVKNIEEIDGHQTPVYTLKVGSVTSNDKFYLQSVDQTYSMDMSKDTEGLMANNTDSYMLTKGNNDGMYLDGSYLNVTFRYIPGSGLFSYTGTKVAANFEITPGNDQTSQSGELDKDGYDIVLTTPNDVALAYIYVPEEYEDEVAYYEVVVGEVAGAAISSSPVTEDGYFTVSLPKETTGTIHVYNSAESTSPAASFNYKVISGIPTGVEALEAEDVKAEYYTLQGLKIANPLPGNIYIKVAGGKSIKIVM